MLFPFQSLEPSARYKLLTGLVVPRPIAWVTTLHPDGSVNVAPFSFFNAIGTDPALVVLGIGDHPDRPKDTAINIERTKQFVVNLVPEELGPAMSDSATDYPPAVSEVAVLGLGTTPSTWVEPPRITGCPAALECVLEQRLTIGHNRIILGRVLGAFVADDKLEDAAKFQVASAALHLIGRMGGLGGYTRTQDVFQLPRQTFAELQQQPRIE
jgi:flavin reductase (DIM6/NTAB) family NADH-FMN oxidoreductase RutF